MRLLAELLKILAVSRGCRLLNPSFQDVWPDSATTTQEESEPNSRQVGAVGDKRTTGTRGKRNALEVPRRRFEIYTVV